METKHDKFNRLIDGRVEKANQALRRLGQLFEKRNYEWSDSQAEQVVDDLFRWVDKIREKAGVN